MPHSSEWTFAGRLIEASPDSGEVIDVRERDVDVHTEKSPEEAVDSRCLPRIIGNSPAVTICDQPADTRVDKEGREQDDDGDADQRLESLTRHVLRLRRALLCWANRPDCYRWRLCDFAAARPSA